MTKPYPIHKIRITMSAGASVEDAADICIVLAENYGCVVECDFNETLMSVSGTRRDDVLKHWWAATRAKG